MEKRAGGEGINSNGKHLELISEDGKLVGIIRNTRNSSENFLEWVKVVGDIFYKHSPNNKTEGEIKVSNNTHQFNILKNIKMRSLKYKPPMIKYLKIKSNAYFIKPLIVLIVVHVKRNVQLMHCMYFLVSK